MLTRHGCGPSRVRSTWRCWSARNDRVIRTSPGGKFTVDEKVPVTAGVHHIGLHHLALKVESEDALSKVYENYRRPVLR